MPNEGAAFHHSTWPEATTPGDVERYATGEFSNRLILLLAAERTQDTEQMLVHIKALRSVVTRLDQFRRMRVRQWRVQPELSPKSTCGPEHSKT
jgi:hypothetical protein